MRFWQRGHREIMGEHHGYKHSITASFTEVGKNIYIFLDFFLKKYIALLPTKANLEKC